MAYPDVPVLNVYLAATVPLHVRRLANGANLELGRFGIGLASFNVNILCDMFPLLPSFFFPFPFLAGNPARKSGKCCKLSQRGPERKSWYFFSAENVSVGK